MNLILPLMKRIAGVRYLWRIVMRQSYPIRSGILWCRIDSYKNRLSRFL